jgi:hypothetical protein
MSDEIVSTELVAVRPTGERILVRIAILRPQQAEHGDWTCQVTGEPLFRGPSDGVVGSDSFQALALAYSLTRQMLDYFIEDGGRLLVPHQQHDEDYPLLAAFGSLRRMP